MRSISYLIVALITVSCGAAAAAPSSAPGGARIIEITMADLHFTPTVITLRQGERVTLRFRNLGTLEHEFMAGLRPIGSKGFQQDWIATAAKNVPSHTHTGEEHLGLGVRVAPDWYGSLDLIVPNTPGEYEFGCFVPGHYEAGMRGKITVR